MRPVASFLMRASYGVWGLVTVDWDEWASLPRCELHERWHPSRTPGDFNRGRLGLVSTWQIHYASSFLPSFFFFFFLLFF